MCDISIPAGELDEWLAVLKPYQRNTIKQFLGTEPPEAAAEKWLGATGSPNIAPFGGTRDTKPFLQLFQSEFRKFLCDDNAYVEEKKLLSGESPVGKAIIVSSVSAALGASIGFSATLLAPAVAIMLCSVGKMGVRAYCAAG
jgi:hypothetical protein